jgi:hypothetical protein
MPLHLVSPQPDKTPRELSVARQALADHLDKERALRSRLSGLGEAQARATAAEHQAQDVRDELVLLTKSEDAAWLEWSAAPNGPVPAPRTEERASIMRRINETQAFASVARRAAESVAPAMHEAALSYRNLAEQRTTLIAQVLIEDASDMQSRYGAALKAAGEIRAALEGVAVALARLGRTNESATVALTFRGLCWAPEGGSTQLWPSPEERAARQRDRERIRDRYLSLADRLSGDADAIATVHLTEGNEPHE